MIFEAAKEKTMTCTILLACVFIMTLWIVPATADDGIVARVNGSELTVFDLEDELNKVVPRGIFHGAMAASKRDKYKPEALEKLIEDELLYQEAKRMGLKADKKRIKETQEAAIEKIGGINDFKNALKQRNMSERQYKKKVERQLLIEMLEKQEINEKSIVTDEEVARHYDENKSSYIIPESRRIWHLVLKVRPESTDDFRMSTKEKAKKIHSLALEGADLEKLAWDYSEGNYRVKGGDFGYVHKGRLEPFLEEVAFSLKKGEFSDVVESQYGYHIIKIIDIKDERQLSLDEVSKTIRDNLSAKKSKERREALISRLRSEAEIEVYQ